MLEFHKEFINLNEKSELALRFNILNADGKIQSPIHNMEDDCIWPEDAVSVSESMPEINTQNWLMSKGIYAVPLGKLSNFNLVSEAMKRKDDIVIYLLEYYEGDLMVSFLNEIAVRQCNIVKVFDKNSLGIIDFNSVFLEHIQKKKYAPFKNTYAREIKKDILKMREENKLNLKRFINNELNFNSSIHGLRHFVNVDSFGQMLAPMTGADINVVRWFAYLHDFCRNNDNADIEHGARAADYINQIRHTYLSELDDAQISMLRVACRWHTETTRLNIPTIDACFDADRLDLPRVGYKLNPNKMATRNGATLAANDYHTNIVLTQNYIDELC